jgi:hypothetical protein
VKIARSSSPFEPKWYWIAELFDDPAIIEICRSDTPSRPRSANRRSAVSMSCSAVVGGGPAIGAVT